MKKTPTSIFLFLIQTYFLFTLRAQEVGVQFHDWNHANDNTRLMAIDKIADMGSQWVRIDMGWASIEYTQKGDRQQWYLNQMDLDINKAKARGLKVLVVLMATPPWSGATTASVPGNAGDYGDIAQWAAAYFKGRVNAWEVWNEPNLSEFFAGTPAQYTALLKASYSRFKTGDPNTKVIFGAPSYVDDGFIKKCYVAGAQGYFDAMSVHPYMGPSDLAPDLPDIGDIYRLAHTPEVKKLMDQYGDNAKKIWFTEFGWSSHSNPSNPPNWERGVTLAQQADFAVKAVQYTKANLPYVEMMCWYNERDRGTSSSQIDNFGLLFNNYNEKPVYCALKNYLHNTTVNCVPTQISLPHPENTGITMYPNPASEQMRVDCFSMVEGELNIQIIDISSRLVKEIMLPLSPGDNQLKFSVGDIPQGIYLISLISEQGKITSKLVIQ